MNANSELAQKTRERMVELKREVRQGEKINPATGLRIIPSRTERDALRREIRQCERILDRIRRGEVLARFPFEVMA